jgi:hypothetical protein
MMGDERPSAANKEPLEALSEQYERAVRVANESLVDSAVVWNAVFRAYAGVFEAARRTYGGMLIDWHQKVLGPPAR